MTDKTSTEWSSTKWQTIDSAPENIECLVYWPTVKLDEYGDLTDEIAEGAIFVSEFQGYWLEPNQVFEHGAHLNDDWEWAENPTHWMPLPPKPDVTKDEAPC